MIEHLEGRLLMTTTANNTGVVTVNTTESGDFVRISKPTGTNVVRISEHRRGVSDSADGGRTEYPLNSVKTINIFLKGGDDSLISTLNVADITLRIDAGAGSDNINVGGTSDRVLGGIGKDTLLINRNGGNKLRGANGAYLDGSSAAGVQATVRDEFDGGDNDDRISAFLSNLAVNIRGGGGNDFIVPGRGADNIDGGTGNGDKIDYFLRDTSRSIRVNLSGADYVNTAAGVARITKNSAFIPNFNAATGSIRQSVTGIEGVRGSRGDDIFIGNDANNLFSAGGGANKAAGGAGFDRFRAFDSNDRSLGGIESLEPGRDENPDNF